MANRITYLLGAGASAQALPLIKKVEQVPTNGPNLSKITDRNILLGLPNELRNFAERFYNDHRWIPRDAQKNVKPATLAELASRCIEFGTPDLYAKYLLEKGDDLNYLHLKNLLANYFIYKQQAGAFDSRALSFLTTISSGKKLPDEIKIISWNYDSQLEIAAKSLRPVNSAESDSITNFISWPNIPSPNYQGQYFLIHLNGIAGYNYHSNDLTALSSDYRLFDHTKEPLLSFAWEEEDDIYKRTFVENRLKLAVELAKDTEILVVIGYSFPFFNRKVDSRIIEAMRPTLKKIYFQDPFLNGDFLYDHFSLPRENDKVYAAGMPYKVKIPIVHIENTEQYYVPYEF